MLTCTAAQHGALGVIFKIQDCVFATYICMCRCSYFVLLIVKSRNMSGWCMFHVHCCTAFEHTAVIFSVFVAVVLSLPALLYPSYMGTSSCVHDCWWAARTAACCIIKATPTIVECCIVSFTATTRAALGVVCELQR